MTLLLASAARATVGGRSGQEDSFRLWPAEGVVPAEGRGGRLAGGARRRHGRPHRRRHRRPDGLQDVHRGLRRRQLASRGAPEDGPAREQRGAGERRRAERRPEGHGLHDRGRLDRRSRHPLDQRRRLAPAALPPPRRHPPQCRPLAGLVPGRAGAPEQDHALRGQEKPQPQRPALGAHGLQDRPHRSARRAAGAAPRRLGACSPATGSARCPATRSPTSSTGSANPRPTRWRTD